MNSPPPSSAPPVPPPDADEHLEQVIGILLRIGVTLAALLVAVGGIVYLARHGTEEVEDRRVFHDPPAEFSRPVAIIRSAPRFNDLGLIQFGLLVLIATPIVRVFFSAWAFARQRDWLYLVFTLVVLTVLLYGLFSGHLV
jgi:uncharacterized membrane protein